MKIKTLICAIRNNQIINKWKKSRTKTKQNLSLHCLRKPITKLHHYPVCNCLVAVWCQQNIGFTFSQGPVPWNSCKWKESIRQSSYKSTNWGEPEPEIFDSSRKSQSHCREVSSCLLNIFCIILNDPHLHDWTSQNICKITNLMNLVLIL